MVVELAKPQYIDGLTLKKEYWTPELIIALVVIVTGVVLRCVGFDGEIWAMTGSAIGFVFGTGYQRVKIQREQRANGPRDKL